MEFYHVAWFYLFIAGILEVTWATGMKASEGFTRLWISVATVVGMIASFYFLALALRSLPLGVAYTVWTGIGAVGTVLVGVLVFEESRDPMKLICIAVIIAGIVGLKLATASNPKPEAHAHSLDSGSR